TYYTPFISAGTNPGAGAETDGTQVKINESAAKELHIDDDLKKGNKPKLDVYAFDLSDEKGVLLPRTKDDLHSLVLDRLHQMAEDLRDKDAELRAKEEAALP